MSLESTVRFHFAKTQNFTATTPCTSNEPLTGRDYIAAMGMAMSRAPMGYSAFMGKVGISENDAARAVSLLTEYALTVCDRVPALRKLPADIKPAVMQTLATYAYLDYCRSAASVKPCECCQATGFMEAEVFTMKSTMFRAPEWAREVTPTKIFEQQREVCEVVRVLCRACNGKGVVSSACRDCKGRGRAVDRKETERQGVPVVCDCKRCLGRGYERMPSTDAHRAACEITGSISLDIWKRGVKPLYDQLISKLEVEECQANAALSKATG